MNPPPYTTRSGWVTLPIEMIRAFVEKSSLPVYECDANKVKKRGCKVLPSVQPTNLPFSAWGLAHAVKKADCARWPSSRTIWPRAVGFFLENIDFFDWSSETFCLNRYMSDFYADFSRTSLSGRIGQGMALLLLEREGYSYVGRFSTIIEQSGHKVKGRAKKSPDFVVENDRNERALAEAKGSFVPRKSSSKPKEALKRAWSQLAGWDKCFSPPPHKGFAIGTFLREIGDSSSLMAFVDITPGGLQAPPEEPQDSIDFPFIEFRSDAIRRANYASWLSLMDFDDAARRLRAREGRPEQRPVSLLTLRDHRYIVRTASIRSPYRHHTHDSDFRRLMREEAGRLLGLWRDGTIIEIVGLDLDVVHALGNAIQRPESPALMEIQLGKRREFADGAFHGSVFSDGSLIGEIATSRLEWRDIEERKITL